MRGGELAVLGSILLSGSVLAPLQAKAFDLTGTWATNPDECKNVFVRKGNNITFAPDVGNPWRRIYRRAQPVDRADRKMHDQGQEGRWSDPEHDRKLRFRYHVLQRAIQREDGRR